MSTLTTERGLRLRTPRKIVEETGVSISFLKTLMNGGVLTRYRIRSAIFISLSEFENLAASQASNSMTVGSPQTITAHD